MSRLFDIERVYIPSINVNFEKGRKQPGEKERKHEINLASKRYTSALEEQIRRKNLPCRSGNCKELGRFIEIYTPIHFQYSSLLL